MSRWEPIDLDTIKFEDPIGEDIYGENPMMKTEPQDPSAREDTIPFQPPHTPSGKKRHSKHPESSPRGKIHRRAPEDADLEDRVIMRLVDADYGWE
jgi:hypothetical protein